MYTVRDTNFSRLAFSAQDDWGRCLTSYLSQIYRKSGSVSSLGQYQANLEWFFSIEPRRLPHFYTREDIERFINRPGTAIGRKGIPVSPGTVNNRLTILNSFYHYAQSYGVTGEDGHLYPLMPYLPPTAGMHFGQCPQSGQKFLSDEELRRFFAAIGTETLRASRDRALFLTFFWTARRATEVTGLRWRDLEKTLIVDGQTTRMAWTYRFFGKGHKRIADVAEYPPIAAAALFKYLEESGRLATMEPDHCLFTALPGHIGKGGYDPKRPLVEQQVWWNAQQYATKAGLGRKISAHTFRHTSARCAYAAGASVRDVQQKLRHRDLATTTIYLETLISVSDPTIDRLQSKYANL